MSEFVVDELSPSLPYSSFDEATQARIGTEASPWHLALLWPTSLELPEVDDTVLMAGALRVRVLEVVPKALVAGDGAQGPFVLTVPVVVGTMRDVEQPDTPPWPLTTVRFGRSG